MKDIHFCKYQATGNDFILIDNRSDFFPKQDNKFISHLCNRHFGIGSDGLILIENDPENDFRMVFFNPDASQSMCGNGGRCAVAFAHKLGIVDVSTQFVAIDGLHQANISDNGIIRLKMNDVEKVEKTRKYVRLNTGSPHHVEIRKDVEAIDVKKEGAKIRYGHSIEGINVNFVEQMDNGQFKVRTYERGVEDETYSCGTGAVAVAIAMHKIGKNTAENVVLQTRGGVLEVSFEIKKKLLGLKKEYENIWLSGGVQFVFQGNIQCDF
ncbi:diaminopimelate epimerase [Capnocytophaga catalasegens]|uniref:Diaminopimelate epimerase n=1 Tax=Capnocytophaga catalasegens TaxID=1004260 RepID=A0AAV5AZK8_9FLAO|nr:diaminopimelate epimerase [Capnocytophaga catalasegens]GIZ14175.1 diaminopimelate epimerase [Capnocytophaga catalasegens]GJM51470.1 diaminopimelate epimerase [Capnocytophaga catalasegens]GJM53978.1 diaminopimelate epimerase [Capnocytophaga catalasegens]